ncbi:MAG: ParB/RepB/Spo0J family partition protein [Dysgonomonas sp.]|jgi:ParB family chromosome partitioning protein|uniref:ParB/RepB/Spo0J family partition protein n=1 Tax=unclassified Dysgonomonas TaxID=2630389 RepID=UPI0025BB347F|nr:MULTISPECIES: ParB/RepB/Spo0J family partition protein [unclassified Dysgonomonas]MDR1715340.1 ParB/RepB/Spo0J family partition protein [Prevotella sp.]MDR2003640.1 ParB/RepB/Spo0J family partition protein [Prevotella sp.]HMM01620.1 ParB/RepB/Spo0J family partition protein [Dysgonomonas sp.]
MAKKMVLGRGLDALITIDEVKTEGSSSINEIELSKIQVNPDQPRRVFDEEALQELAVSIRQIGVIQPITLRKIDEDSYQIIAGERRYRASSIAGLSSIPAYIRTAEDETVMEMALIENIQREDLNSIEIALAYQNLIEAYNLTQERLSERIGKKRTTIANYLRLLKLPAEIQMGIRDKKIDMAHARTLVTLEDAAAQLEVYELILEEGLSVRKVEEYVRAIAKGEKLEDLLKEEKVVETVKKSGVKKATPEEFEILKTHLSKFFSTKVQLTCNDKGKGKISIPFKTEEELERIISIFDQLKK